MHFYPSNGKPYFISRTLHDCLVRSYRLNPSLSEDLIIYFQKVLLFCVKYKNTVHFYIIMIQHHSYIWSKYYTN